LVYDYTQIRQYLRCRRSYRYRYLDGWREKDTRAAMVIGRCFENAVAISSTEQYGNAVQSMGKLLRSVSLDCGKGGSWDKPLHQGMNLFHKLLLIVFPVFAGAAFGADSNARGATADGIPATGIRSCWPARRRLGSPI
jgi:hypothetical protein